MRELNEPVPGHWYIKRNGKMMKVRMVAYSDVATTSVLIESLQGHTQVVDIDDWRKFDLIVPRRGADESQAGI